MRNLSKKFKLVVVALLMAFTITTFATNKDVDAAWNKYGNFKKLKANNGYKYKLFQDYYVEELAMNKTIKVYFNLNKTTDPKVRKAMKNVIKDFTRISHRKIKLVTSRPKSGKYFTVNVVDFRNGAKNKNSRVIASTSATSMKVYKSITKHKYNLYDYEAILAHEFLHVFGISHTSQRAKNTLMGPIYKNVKTFNLKKYKNDVSAWKTLNSPYRSTSKSTKRTKTVTARFLNTYAHSKKYYKAKKVHQKKYITKATYYTNGKKSKYITYAGKKGNARRMMYTYKTNGKNLAQKIQYSTAHKNLIVKKIQY